MEEITGVRGLLSRQTAAIEKGENQKQKGAILQPTTRGNLSDLTLCTFFFARGQKGQITVAQGSLIIRYYDPLFPYIYSRFHALVFLTGVLVITVNSAQ